MSTARAAALLLCLACALWARPLGAAPAPHLGWSTIKTPCCDIHYHQSVAGVASRVAALADECVKNAEVALEATQPERIQIVINDVTDSPNGFANVVPYSRVELRAVPPEDDAELAVADDYLRLLLQHEIWHIVHLDVIHGLPALVNLFLGKSWPPNSVQPRFVVEGMATWAETRFTGGGRLRSTLFRSQVRVAALAGDAWSLDDVTNASRRPPGGLAAYAYGALFLEWMVARHGERIFAVMAHEYGGIPIPYAVQRSVEAATGRDMAVDWAEFQQALDDDAAHFRAQVAARGGVTPARRLTRFGGAVRSPVFGPDGTLYVSAHPPTGPPALFALRGLPAAAPRPEPVVRLNATADLAFDDDGALLLSQPDVFLAYFNSTDVWRLDERGALRRQTDGLRVHHPQAIGDGRLLVEHRTGDESGLLILERDGRATPLVLHHDGSQSYTPSVSPDRAHVVVSRFSPGGGRNLVEIDLATGVERALTDDGAQNLDPVYSLDGAHVLYASDRAGTFNIYAVDKRDGTVRRLTNTLGVALQPQPTPDGRGFVYVDVHLDGQDLYAAALDLTSAPVVGVDDDRTPWSQRPLNTAPPARASLDDATPYNPLPTLYPRSWIPLLASDPLGGLALGAVLAGSDAAELLSWSAQGTWGFAQQRPRLSASLRLNDFYLPVTLTLEHRTDAGLARFTDGLPDLHEELVTRATGTVSIPFRSRRQSHSLQLGLSRDMRHVLDPVRSGPDDRAPRLPPRGDVNAFVIDYFASSLEAYRDSVSSERGWFFFTRLRHGSPLLLASDFETTDLTVDARVFRPVPGLNNVVAALYLSGGVGFGERSKRATFGLGGVQDRDLTSDIVNNTRSGQGLLRGYPNGFVGGDSFALSTFELRAPLWEVERGIETLPVFFERVHAAAFADVGGAFVGAPTLDAFRAGLGVELRANIILGYYGLFVVRVGYARGVNAGGVDQPYAILGFPY